MELKVNSVLDKKIIAMFSYLILGIAFVFDYQSYLDIAILTITHLFFTAIAFKAVGIKIISVPFLFYAFSIVFHLGHVFLQFGGNEAYQAFHPLTYLSGKYTFEAINFVLRVHYFLVLGILLYGVCRKQKNKTKSQSQTLQNKMLVAPNGDEFLVERYLCLIMFAISVIPMTFLNAYSIYLSIKGGYLNTFLAIPGWFIIFKYLFNVSVIGFIICNKNKKKKALLILLATIIFNLISMLSGGRIEATITIIITCIVYKNFVGVKFTVFKTLLFVLLAVAFLNTITYIGDSRIFGFEIQDWASNLFSAKFIKKILGDFGGTLISVVKSFEAFPEYVDYNYGKTYFISLMEIFPKVNALIPDFAKDTIFIFNFADHNYLGGSYIGELYFNFGQWSLPFASVIGVFAAKIYFTLKNAAEENKVLLYLVTIPLAFPFLTWVRGYAVSFVRAFFWLSLLIYLLYRMVKGYISRYTVDIG